MRRESTDPQTYAVIGAAMKVHSELGAGFLERVYRDAMHAELADSGVPFRAEVPLPVRYRGVVLGSTFRADLICFDVLLVELKALGGIGGSELAQTINYLRPSRLPKALILNFGAARLQSRRVVL